MPAAACARAGFQSINSKAPGGLGSHHQGAGACLGVGWSEVDEIDGLGILTSTFVAMQRAVHALFLSASCTQGESACSLNSNAQALIGPKGQLIVDGSLHPARYLGEKEWPWPTEIMVKADATQLEVAAASILAKTAEMPVWLLLPKTIRLWFRAPCGLRYEAAPGGPAQAWTRCYSS